MNSKILITVVAVVLLGGIGFYIGRGAGGDTVTAPVEMPELEGNSEALVELAQGVALGDPDAPITIVEFADYQCPACQRFSTMVKPQIQAAYVDEGIAKFVFYDFPLASIHPHAFIAARAARCAEDQDRFWAYHDEIFRNQSSWSLAASPPLGEFEDYAATVGLDQDAFSACLRSDRHADLVTANLILGQQLGVGGTPTVMVSRGGGMARRVPSNAFPDIAAVVEELRPQEAGADTTDGGAGS
jgi:protein-disulfide isomerase